MRILPITPEGLIEAVRTIHAGGIVAHPTETCYGLACDLTNPAAVEKLFVLKERPHGQAVSALFPSIEAAKKYVEWNDVAERLARMHLPGPITIILPLRTPLVRGTSTLGVRVSSHPFAQRFSASAGVPLSTTSANIHGQANPYSAQDIEEQFHGKDMQPDLLLDGGVLPRTSPSTVVAVQEGEIVIVRQGSTKVE